MFFKKKNWGKKHCGQVIVSGGPQGYAIIHVNAIIQDLKHGENLELRSSLRNVTYFLNENCRLHIFL
jgi:hypothetical protein